MLTTMPRTIPRHGLSEEEILSHFDELKKADTDWRGGRAFSLVYSAGEEHEAFLKKAHQAFFSENALNPLACKSSRRLELETVRMAANLFHGGRDAVGSLSTGGTESILLAVKAAKTRAQSNRSLSKPNMVVPETAHVAFDKAGAYFGVEVRYARLRDDYLDSVSELAERLPIRRRRKRQHIK